MPEGGPLAAPPLVGGSFWRDNCLPSLLHGRLLSCLKYHSSRVTSPREQREGGGREDTLGRWKGRELPDFFFALVTSSLAVTDDVLLLEPILSSASLLLLP